MEGLGRHYEIDVSCAGEPDAVTGYLINIKDIDAVVRRGVLPIVERACREKPWTNPACMLRELIDALRGSLRARLVGLRFRLTPYYSIEMCAETTDRFTLRQQFDFAAAHRLHVESLGAARNREVFGRCNNPHAHGHNYRIEPAVSVTFRDGEPAMTLADLEQVTAATIIDRFDHKNLSVDSPEFAAPNGVNPSVENIARVFYELLAPEIAKASEGRARLTAMTVWETDRTSCVYEPAS